MCDRNVAGTPLIPSRFSEFVAICKSISILVELISLLSIMSKLLTIYAISLLFGNLLAQNNNVPPRALWQALGYTPPDPALVSEAPKVDDSVTEKQDAVDVPPEDKKSVEETAPGPKFEVPPKPPLPEPVAPAPEALPKELPKPDVVPPPRPRPAPRPSQKDEFDLDKFLKEIGKPQFVDRVPSLPAPTPSRPKRPHYQRPPTVPRPRVEDARPAGRVNKQRVVNPLPVPDEYKPRPRFSEGVGVSTQFREVGDGRYQVIPRPAAPKCLLVQYYPNSRPIKVSSFEEMHLLRKQFDRFDTRARLLQRQRELRNFGRSQGPFDFPGGRRAVGEVRKRPTVTGKPKVSPFLAPPKVAVM